jgi:hypothetical protein
VADLSTASSDPVVFPHIAAGGGYTTQIILINRSAAPIRGRVRLFDDAGLPLPLQISGVAVTDFEYQIAPNGVYRVELGSPQLSVGSPWPPSSDRHPGRRFSSSSPEGSSSRKPE